MSKDSWQSKNIHVHTCKLNLNALKVKLLQIHFQIRYIRVLQRNLNEDNMEAVSWRYKDNTLP
jgi:hypothetical protein